MINNRRALILISTLIGAVSGAAGGYLFAKEQLEMKYEELTAKEIADAKTYYSTLYKGPGFQTPTEVLEGLVEKGEIAHEELQAFDEIVDHLNYGTPSTPAAQTLQPTRVRKNVFDNPNEAPDDADWSHEEAMRNPDYPYIISFEEFNEGSQGHSQVTLTYFQADDTLTEPNDAIVDNVDYLVGSGNLDRFGHRSTDPNVVYVRNENVSIDFEIIRSSGSYAEEVGMERPERPTRPKKRQSRSPRE